MKQVLVLIERIAVIIGVVLLFFVVLETIDAFNTLKEFHPWAGYGFLGLLGLLIIYLVAQLSPFFRLAKIPSPPELPQEGEISQKTRKDVCRYLSVVADRFESNPILQEEVPLNLENLRKQIEELNKSGADNFRERINLIEKDYIEFIIKVLDRKAEEVVSDSVGIVSVGTALSPYRSVDFAIVILRNFRMVNSILRIYRTRPSARETFKVFYDILRVVAAVNLLNSMDQIWTGLGRHVPLLSTYGEAVSEGLFSGLLTSVAGHAAIDRCRTYKPWNTDAAANKYRKRLQRWGNDILSILRRHGVQRLIGKIKPKDRKKGEQEEAANTDNQVDTGVEPGK